MNLLKSERDAALRVSEKRYEQYREAVQRGASPEELSTLVGEMRAAAKLLKQLDDAVKMEIGWPFFPQEA